MNLDEARVVLRPRSSSEILDLALRFISAAAVKRYVLIGLLSLLPAWLICVYARFGLHWEWPAVWLLTLAFVTPLQGLYTIAVGRLMFAEQVRLRTIFGQYFRRLPAYLVTLVLTRVMLGIMSMLAFLLLPPFWMWGRINYVHEACLLEQAGPVDAIGRASRMVSRNTMGAVGLVLLLLVAAAGFVLIAELLINVGLLDFVLQVGKPFGSLFDEGGSAAALLGAFLAVPYWATARFLAYADLRTRRDGWDVQLRFMAIQAKQQGAGAEAHS
jgi:hypothetical protein